MIVRGRLRSTLCLCHALFSLSYVYMYVPKDGGLKVCKQWQKLPAPQALPCSDFLTRTCTHVLYNMRTEPVVCFLTLAASYVIPYMKTADRVRARLYSSLELRAKAVCNYM